MCNGVNCMHKTTRGVRLSLRAPLGPDHLVEPADIVDTKKSLMALGYYAPLESGEPGAWVDNDLFAGIKRFQRDNGLQVDALIRPGGPTERALNEALDETLPPPANDDRPPANDDKPVAMADCWHQNFLDTLRCGQLALPEQRRMCRQSASIRLDMCNRGLPFPPLQTGTKYGL